MVTFSTISSLDVEPTETNKTLPAEGDGQASTSDFEIRIDSPLETCDQTATVTETEAKTGKRYDFVCFYIYFIYEYELIIIKIVYWTKLGAEPVQKAEAEGGK